ncbi:MAG: ATP-binding cassette domain-containing protein [Thermodesulfobacteriota bacterium]
MFEIERMTVTTGAFCLRDIELSVARGKGHAVIGPSGAGKTTLMKAVLGVIPPERGRILLDDEDITRHPVERRGLGYLPQQLGLFPHLTVRDNLNYSARARGIPSKQFQPLVDKLVEATGIAGLLDRLPMTLSGGERQRVGLVRALASRPRLVLLDEPFTALNESLRRELWWLVRELQEEQNLTVLLITHDLTEAYFLADRVSILLDGRIRQQGDKSTVYRRPADTEVAHFLGINNLWDGKVAGREGDRLLVDCSVLGLTLRMPAGENAPIAGTTVAVGILSDDIKLCDAAHPPQSGELALKGKARLLDLDTTQLVHFQHTATNAILKFEVPRRTAARFGLNSDNNILTVSLPETSLFWMPCMQ